MTRSEWLAYTDGQPNAFAYRRGAKHIVRQALNMAADYGVAVGITHEGRPAGYLTAAMIWTHVTDDRLARAIEAIEEGA